MKTTTLYSLTFLGILILSMAFASAKKAPHLFILSGQSNMVGLDPEVSFIPAVEKEFGAENIIIVKDAQGGQPIRRWYKNWQSAEGNKSFFDYGDLYDQLMEKVKVVTKGKKIGTISFIWMQGEKDARESHGIVYADSFRGLISQLQSDLGRNDINVVLGRLSDFDMKNQKYPHWTIVRDAIVDLAEADPSISWVDTDDLNDGLNKKGKEIKDDLHYSVNGYKVLGDRFAKEAISLISK